MARFSQANAELLRANLKATRVMALTTPLMELIGGCAVAGILYYGHFRILPGPRPWAPSARSSRRSTPCTCP